MPLPHGDRAIGYRAKRRLGEGVACGLLVAAALALGGCGTSGLLAGGDEALFDPLTTGSLGAAPRADARPSTLDLERAAFARATAALADALDPLGPGDPVAWSDPESGARGTIAAAAGPSVEGDLVCRRFRAESTLRDGAFLRHLGHACRIAAGTWRIEAADLATDADDDDGTDAPAAAALPGGGLPTDLMPDLGPERAG